MEINIALFIAILFGSVVFPADSLAQQNEYLEYFSKVEVPAQYNYRYGTWFNTVERNFDFTTLPVNGTPKSARITIRLGVNKAGKITAVYYLSGDKFLFNPVCNMLSKCSEWLPGIISGRKVNSYRSLSISFSFNKQKNKWEFVRSIEDYNATEPIIFTKTEIIASYINYSEKYWFDFVDREFDFTKLPSSGLPDSLSATVRFAILNDGRIFEISFINNSHCILFAPLYDLLQKSYGRWNPAKQGGKDVNSYRRLRFSFKFDKNSGEWEFIKNVKDYMIFTGDR